MPESRNIPQHVAVIMDGNRRWARMRSISSVLGHDKGSSVIEGIARHAYDMGVKWLTLFAFSTENWRRSPVEVRGIMSVLERYLKTKMHTLMENSIRLRVIGDLSGFSTNTIEMLRNAVKETSTNDGLNLTVALGYGGHADITGAARRLAEMVRNGEMEPSMIDADLIKDHLHTRDLPPVDLLIRTGQEQRISNFLLWDLAYAEFAFTDTLWPDFTPHHFSAILEDYASRNRRFGGDDEEDGSSLKVLSS